MPVFTVVACGGDSDATCAGADCSTDPKGADASSGPDDASNPTNGDASSPDAANPDAGKTPKCGDGVRDTGETCDDGNRDDTDACRNDCASATCGDGVVQENVEACDDGNQVETDGCLNNCVAATCGDGKVQAGIEQCDDGNQDETDGCLNNCKIDCSNVLSLSGAVIAGSSSTASIVASAGTNLVFSAPESMGLSVQADGAITGTPTTSGNVALQVTATWNNVCTVHQDVVVPVGCPTQSIEPATMIRVFDTVNTSGLDLKHKGAIGASTFTVTEGAWPAGMTVTSSGAASGTPTFGNNHVVVQAKDAAGCVSTVTYDFPVCRQIGRPVPATWTPMTYGTGIPTGASGYILGLNAYLDKEKAQFLDLSALPYTTISDVAFLAGVANTTDRSKVIGVRVYDGTDGTPGAMIGAGGSVTMGAVMDDVAAARWTDVGSPTTLPASKKIFVSVVIDQLQWNAAARDVFGLVSNTAGQTVPTTLWEKWSDDSWHRFTTSGSWNLSVSAYAAVNTCP